MKELMDMLLKVTNATKETLSSFSEMIHLIVKAITTLDERVTKLENKNEIKH